MKNISERLIKPLKRGLVYISPMKKMLNYELMTDNEILLCVKKGYLSAKGFDWTEYNNAQKPAGAEPPVESPVESPTEEKTPEVEPIDANPEESPVESPVEEKTPTKKPKRNSKKGSK